MTHLFPRSGSEEPLADHQRTTRTDPVHPPQPIYTPTMTTKWGDDILICHLADEPELSEEFAGIFAVLNDHTAGHSNHVVLNFSGVTYLNSSHIAQLLRMRKRLMDLDRTLVLCAMTDNVWSVLSLSGLDKVFRYAPDPMTALAGLQLESSPSDEGG
jgi:anti-anti-sigma factor